MYTLALFVLDVLILLTAYLCYSLFIDLPWGVFRWTLVGWLS